MHGKVSPVQHDGKGVFSGMAQDFQAGRYHSLIAEPQSIPDVLEVTARTARGRDHGRAPPVAADRGSAVSPGKRAHAGRAGVDGQFPEDCSARCRIPAKPFEHLLERRDLTEREAAALLELLTTGDARARHGRRAARRAARQGGDAPRRCAASPAPCARWRASPICRTLPDAIDIVGTGGDSSGSFNLSTGAALLAAACGLPVVKHGNRSITSRSGSADLIEQLGFTLPLDEHLAAQCFAATGFTFLFAPYFHPAMKTLAPIRAALKVRTVFNLLGPLTNPAAPRFRLIGAYDESTAELMADSLVGGADRARLGGAWRRRLGRSDADRPVRRLRRDPRRGPPPANRSAGFWPAALQLRPILKGGDAAANLAALHAVFDGRDRGAHRAALILQCGLALFIAGRAASIAAGHRDRRRRDRQRPRAPMAAGIAAVRGRLGALMSGFLDEMARSSAERAAQAARREPLGALERRARDAPAAPALRLSPAGFDVIAELKLRSPAAGVLGDAGQDWLARVGAYARGGAAAVSVLTEPSRFDGSLAHLEQAASLLKPSGIPAMRKDFIVDPYQVLEARAAGAGGVLVILRMLPRARIAELLEVAAGHGLFVLLEAFDAADLELAGELLERGGRRAARCCSSGSIAAICRLCEVVPDRFAELAPRLPHGWPAVAESGVASGQPTRGACASLGYRLALIGTALMSREDPAALLEEIFDATRTVPP